MSKRIIMLSLYDDIEKEDKPILEIKGKYETKYWDSTLTDCYYMGIDPVDEPLRFSLILVRNSEGEKYLKVDQGVQTIGAVVGYRSATTLMVYDIILNLDKDGGPKLRFREVKNILKETVNDTEDKDITVDVVNEIKKDFLQTKNNIKNAMSDLFKIMQEYIA